jgi:hypothetical protein
MPRKAPRVTTRLGGVRKQGSAGNCAALSSALALTERIRSTKLRLWRTESLARGTKLKLLLMPRVNRRDRSAGPGQDVGRLAKRALFISVLNCCCTVQVTRSVASVPCQRSGRTFLDCKVGTRPQQRGFQVWKQICTLGYFLVNLGYILYLLSCKYIHIQSDTFQYIQIHTHIYHTSRYRWMHTYYTYRCYMHICMYICMYVHVSVCIPIACYNNTIFADIFMKPL